MSQRYLLWISEQQPTSEIQQVVFAENFKFLHTNSISDAVSHCLTSKPELVFVDADTQQLELVELVKLLRKTCPTSQIVTLVDSSQSEIASKTINAGGAVDYLLKPFFAEQLKKTIRNTDSMKHGFEDLIAASTKSQQVLRLANRAAQTAAGVLITGESGTGKEKLAHFIHKASERRDKPFIAVNCAAIPENMLEAMLFGFNKGAFTGAVNAQPGKFELANGGTILLDEITELPLELQAKLLRVLQEREVERLGSHQKISLDIRIIAASNRVLREQVEQGAFREDLFYRLDVLPLSWPALRDRIDDIIPLAHHFIKKYGSSEFHISKQAEDVMLCYNWPGNVREIENVIQRALVMARGVEIQVEDLNLPACSPVAVDFCASQLKENKKQAEFDYIYSLLSRFKGHRTQTAQALGVTTRALRYKIAAMRECGIDIDAIA
ncbi:sigma-54-dependent Fis family transcriptional regulator [Pseudoalteromonas sp. Scap03]|uniref:sigma-54-dependent transcriptional regulator n=1 Tax=unclassified Pseudoalteromonas TaxID=194690 RepID=UPI0015BA62B6|nr:MULTISPECIES: sigma-54 dependent transcriptional regulator [unclassified Pseudoalteromonas]NWL15725.1 sigma-54-dependent Fis family transcriptional regulator [Pseudoalteromonas sp. Scap03]QLE80869.1 sigma-54-dependent Fis family transcriptional regulator [Pseudoalteromonas sp. Scap25]QLE88812.1 sigma-54-dependent Fis family transcriptional regulator [Pseudoalteromonas sp. Scap06]